MAKGNVINKFVAKIEIDPSTYSSGYVHGFVHGFKRGSRVDKSENTELCVITTIVLKGNTIDSYEFAEIINDKKE